MKQKLLSYIALIFLGYYVLLINSCVKKDSSIQDCQAKVDASIPVSIAPDWGDVTFDMDVFNTKNSKTECQIGIANSLADDKFEKIISALKIKLALLESPTQKTIAIVLYRIGDLLKDSTVNIKNLVGISRYYKSSEKLFHQFFVKKISDNTFNEITDLSAEVDGVVFNYMHIIGKQVLNSQSQLTALFIKNETSKGIYSTLKQPHDDLSWKLKVYILKLKLQNKNKSYAQNSSVNNTDSTNESNYADPANCGSPCTANDGSVCRNGDRPTVVGENESSAKCGPKVGICQNEKIYSYLSNSTEINQSAITLYNGNVASLDDCINLNILRNFRDNVLYNSAIGINYVSNYYMLSSKLDNVLDLPTAIQTASVGFDVNIVINLLMDSKANSQTILITSQFKNEVIDLLNLYKSKTIDAEAITAINSIINDMNSLEGKTIAQVRSLLSM